MNMEKHVKILGALYIALSVPNIFAALIVSTVFVGSGILSGDPEAMAILNTVGSMISYFLVIISVPGLIVGFGLLARKNWARLMAVIMGFINLPNMPLGTAVGIYTFWVLLQDESDEIFE
ncbi:hypothetical protein HQ585_04380 [candidate division KSB1 bacterium]|nr:hypothetical protein [candidate division KSB1 bacterium]